MVCMCQPLSFECAPGDCIIGRRGEEEGYCVGQGKFDIQKREGEGSVAFGRNFTETSASFG